MKKILDEFKTFIMRGNVMDLAIGVIIGGAFQGIVNSLVDDVIMPIISLLTGGIDFSNWFIQLGNRDKIYLTLADAQADGAAVLAYGHFITAVINFLIMAFVIFCIVKTLNTLNNRKKPAPAAPTTKKCPYCQSEISINATRCPHCTSTLE